MIDHLLTVAEHLVGPGMRAIYTPNRMSNRILCAIPDYGPALYINRHQEAIVGILLRFRNGLPFALECESIVLKIDLDARHDLGKVTYEDRFKLEKWGGETTTPIERCNLSTADAQWVKKSAWGEVFSLNTSLHGHAHFKTWFGEFDLPINLVCRTLIDLRDDRP